MTDHQQARPTYPPQPTTQAVPSPYGAPATPYGSPAAAYGTAPAAPDGYSAAPAAAAPYGPLPTYAPPAPVTEDVARGLLFALAAIPVGVVASVLVWKAGYVASISAFVVAALAVWLYRKGAGAIGRPGFAVVAGVSAVGLVASMAGIIVSDLVEYYGANSADIAVSESTFVTSNLFNGDVWGSYGSDFGMFVLFGLLGAAGTLLRLRRATR